MIKNRDKLLKNITADIKEQRSLVLDIANFVLEHCKPAYFLKNKIEKEMVRHFERIAVIGIGKAARGMVDAILSQLPRKPDFVCLADGGHPLPTKRGVKNTQKIIEVAQKLGASDLAIVLISGGGSAMFVKPAAGITLNDKISVTRLLLKAGAPIYDLSIVRRQLSEVKDGGLARLLYPATVWGLIMSDVAGNDPGTIAGGPLSPHKTNAKDALRIINKYIPYQVPPRVLQFLQRATDTQASTFDKKYFEKINLEIVADHYSVLKIAHNKAKKLGLRVAVQKKLLDGETRDVARNFIKKAQKNTLLIAAGETTVTCRGKGHGGRNQEFVLSALRFLKPHQTILAIGTDGVDGMCPEKICGAIGDQAIIEKAALKKLSIKHLLDNNDSYTFFKKTGGHIKTGSTGTNLGDLMLLLS